MNTSRAILTLALSVTLTYLYQWLLLQPDRRAFAGAIDDMNHDRILT